MLCLCKMFELPPTHPPADLWPVPVRLQWNGQSRIGLRPYPRSCDHEFTRLRVVSRQKNTKNKPNIKKVKEKGKKNTPLNTDMGKGTGGWGPVLCLVLLFQPHLKERADEIRLNTLHNAIKGGTLSGMSQCLQQWELREREACWWNDPPQPLLKCKHVVAFVAFELNTFLRHLPYPTAVWLWHAT